VSIVGSAFIQPLTICEVEVETATAEHEMTTIQVKLGYYRIRINKALFARVETLMKLEDEAEQQREIFTAFLHVVGWWNLVQDEGGGMWPLTAEAIAPMDPYFIGKVFFGLLGHSQRLSPGEASRGPQKPAPSSATSAVEEQPTTSQAVSSPPSSIISISQTASRRSSPGNGSKRRATTTTERSSGARRKSS
jgi:hypothetical protein